MALLKITCSSCAHVYYRLIVQCNREGVDTTCPNPECGAKEGEVSIVKTSDGSSPFRPCTHLD